jgi:hypothetical protein
MKYYSLLAFAFLFPATAVNAQVTTYTNAADFHAANPDVAIIEDFEDSDPAIRDTTLPSYTSPGGEISFTPVSSYPFAPNVVVATPGHDQFAPDQTPTTSIVLAATGNEDFVATLASPAQALGFDVYSNDWPLTLSFFNGDTLLGTLIDNIFAGPAGVPEPVTWAMMLFGFGAVGWQLRRRRAAALA